MKMILIWEQVFLQSILLALSNNPLNSLSLGLRDVIDLFRVHFLDRQRKINFYLCCRHAFGSTMSKIFFKIVVNRTISHNVKRTLILNMISGKNRFHFKNQVCTQDTSQATALMKWWGFQLIELIIVTILYSVLNRCSNTVVTSERIYNGQ